MFNQRDRGTNCQLILNNESSKIDECGVPQFAKLFSTLKSSLLLFAANKLTLI